MLLCLRRVAVHLYHLFCPPLPHFLWVLYPWPISRYYLVALLGRPWGFSPNTCIVTWGSMCHIRQQICTLQDHLNIFQREKAHVPIFFFLSVLSQPKTNTVCNRRSYIWRRKTPSQKHLCPGRKHCSGPVPHTCLNGRSLQCCKSWAWEYKGRKGAMYATGQTSDLHKSRLCSDVFPPFSMRAEAQARIESQILCSVVAENIPCQGVLAVQVRLLQLDSSWCLGRAWCSSTSADL